SRRHRSWAGAALGGGSADRDLGAARAFTLAAWPTGAFAVGPSAARAVLSPLAPFAVRRGVEGGTLARRVAVVVAAALRRAARCLGGGSAFLGQVLEEQRRVAQRRSQRDDLALGQPGLDVDHLVVVEPDLDGARLERPVAREHVDGGGAA